MRTESQECFKCDDCEKQNAKRMDYNRHRKQHDKPHLCSLCTKCFGLKTDLERHRQTHLGRNSRRYMRCNFPRCKFQTTRKDYLWTHLQKKHPDKKQHNSSGKTLREHYEKCTQGPWTSQQDLNVQLLEAANEGDTAKVRELLSREVNESILDGVGRTPLHLAATQGHLDIVALLCQNAAAANETLQNAVDDDKQEVVEVLIENGVDINQPGIASSDLVGYWRTPLYRAVLKENETMIHFLLNHGADINRRQPDDSHETALHRAVIWGSGVTRILLEANPDIEAKDGTGRTPLENAIEDIWEFPFDPIMTRLLLEAGAVVKQWYWDKIPWWFRERNPQYAPSAATLLSVAFPITP